MFAEFETNLRRERQMEDIAAAKARGAYKGRKLSIDSGVIRQLQEKEQLGRASVYCVLGKRKAA